MVKAHVLHKHVAEILFNKVFVGAIIEMPIILPFLEYVLFNIILNVNLLEINCQKEITPVIYRQCLKVAKSRKAFSILSHLQKNQ